MRGTHRPDYTAGRPEHMRHVPSRSVSPVRSSNRRKRDASPSVSQDPRVNAYRDYRDRSPDSHIVFARPLEPRPSKRSRRQHPTESQDPSTTRPQSASMEKPQHNRKTPSSSIRSLRKLLNNPSSRMPATVRQEKERELASLLLDKEKRLGANEKKKQTSKYHFVRFIERQKAERKLKSLERRLQAHREDSPKKEGVPEERQLEKEIQHARVDVAYTIYTPLISKYISLFAEGDPQLTDRIASMSKKDRAVMTQEELDKIMRQRDDSIGVILIAGGEKPPGWYTVEKLMGNQKALERLRDGGTDTWGAGGEMTIGIVGGKKEPTKSTKPAWTDDDGVIDPEDLDSDSNSDSDGGVDLKMADENNSDDEFFE